MAVMLVTSFLGGLAGAFGWVPGTALAALRYVPSRVNALSLRGYVMLLLAGMLLWGVGQKLGNQAALFNAAWRDAEKLQNASRDRVESCRRLEESVRWIPEVDTMCREAAMLARADPRTMALEKRMLAMPSLEQLLSRTWDSVANRIYVLAGTVLGLLLLTRLFGTGQDPLSQWLTVKREKAFAKAAARELRARDGLGEPDREHPQDF